MSETVKPEKKPEDNKELLHRLGIKWEGDGGQDVAHLEEIKRNNRREDFV